MEKISDYSLRLIYVGGLAHGALQRVFKVLEEGDAQAARQQCEDVITQIDRILFYDPQHRPILGENHVDDAK
jgi:hypothetical protein